MKSFLRFVPAIGLLVLTLNSWSQSKPYNIVFDITTGDTAVHAKVIRWSKAIVESHPDAKVEIVLYGKSLNMVVKDKSNVEADVMKLASEKKVIFAVCEEAMKFHSISKSQLINGVGTVPDGLYELISRQADGYGYIKVVN
jgi:intracellular sulfur oxidation DsrE/DsrF family protein